MQLVYSYDLYIHLKKHILFWVGVKSDDPLLQEKHGGFKYPFKPFFVPPGQKQFLNIWNSYMNNICFYGHLYYKSTTPTSQNI